MKAIRIASYGGPEVMAVEDIPVPEPGPGQALVQVAAAGVNFIDIYDRTGSYPGELPMTLGREGAGVVEAVGPDVTEVSAGDRVAWTMLRGSYAEYCLLPADRLVPVPAGLGFTDAAAAMLQPITAHYLTRSTYPLGPGQSCLVHAAAGGVGLLLCQLAAAAGAHVIGTVSTADKARLALEAGARDVILYRDQDFVAEVRRLVGGVHVVYDGVGRDTFARGFDCLLPRGYMVLFGQSSGKVEPIEMSMLNKKGSLFATRPTVVHHIADRAELLSRARDVFALIAKGTLRLRVDDSLSLEEAAEAHRLLGERKTVGKLVLRR
jgi:NADPH2:quinone reductase